MKASPRATKAIALFPGTTSSPPCPPSSLFPLPYLDKFKMTAKINLQGDGMKGCRGKELRVVMTGRE